MSRSRRFVLLAAWASFAVGCALFALTAARAWISHPFAIPHVIYVEKPIAHLLGGFAALFVGYLIRSGYRNSAREWGRFAGKCVLLVFSVGLSFLIGEIGYRALLLRQQHQNSFQKFRADHAAGRKPRIKSTHPLTYIIAPSQDLRLIYELQPGLDMLFGHRRLRTSSDGLRDSREYALDRRPNSVRIVGLGDSGMFGWNVEQDEDYMAVLEKNLVARTNGVLYEVINLAVPGYNTQLECESLRFKGMKYQPDIVVIGWCANDYDVPFFLLETENFKRRDRSFLYTWLFEREKLSALAGGFQVKHHRDLETPAAPGARSAETAVESVSAAMRDISKLCAKQRARLLVFGPMDRNIVKICREQGIAFCNTLDEIRSDEYPQEWAVHFMHPRAEGHRVLAERLEQKLDQLGWLQPAR